MQSGGSARRAGAAFERPLLASQIPLLTKQRITLGQLKPNSLVRYRGMVQDTFDVEFCPTAYLGTDSAGSEWRQ